MRISARLLAILCLVSGPLTAATAPPVPPALRLVEPGEKILFLGDSNTQNGFYVACVDAFLRREAPEARLTVLNLGLSSETASGQSESDHPFPRPCVHQRLEAVLDFVKPDAVFFCYGMNDGIYHPPSADRFQAFRDGVNRLVSASRAAGARVVALTPPPFDPLSKPADSLLPAGLAGYSYRAPYSGYDEVLVEYGRWLLTDCEGLAGCIDIHRPLTVLNDACRRIRSSYRSGDGIHPSAAGHVAMAVEILQALGFDRSHARSVLEREAGLSLEPARLAWAELKSGRNSELLETAQQRLQLLLASYREHTGHGHPEKARRALPPAEADARAAELELRMAGAIQESRALAALVRSQAGACLEAGKLVGAVTWVARRGRVEDLQAHGLADRESGRAMQTDAIFRIHSCTKAVTSAAALMLQEEGKFAFDDPIARWIPEFAQVKVGEKPATQPIRVRHLFTHSSGISYANRAVFEEPDLASMARALARTPLAHEPGQGWTYGASIDVLGRLIEIWSGESYDQFLRRRLLEPLGMVDTAFHVPASKRSRLATLYRDDPQHPGALLPSQSSGRGEKPVPGEQPGLCQPGGGLYSTASDYGRFLLMLQNGGEWEGRRYLRPETVALMRTNQLEPAAGWVRFGEEIRDGFGYGYGCNVVVQPSRFAPAARPAEAGWGGTCSCHYWMHPEDQLAIITLEQTFPFRWTLEDALKKPLYEHFDAAGQRQN